MKLVVKKFNHKINIRVNTHLPPCKIGEIWLTPCLIFFSNSTLQYEDSLIYPLGGQLDKWLDHLDDMACTHGHIGWHGIPSGFYFDFYLFN
jgi:hypothetical protein